MQSFGHRLALAFFALGVSLVILACVLTPTDPGPSACCVSACPGSSGVISR